MRWTRATTALAAAALASAALAAGPDEVAPSAAEVRPLLVGAEVPRTKVRSFVGEPVDLNQLFAQKPTIVLFYRGGW